MVRAPRWTKTVTVIGLVAFLGGIALFAYTFATNVPGFPGDIPDSLNMPGPGDPDFPQGFLWGMGLGVGGWVLLLIRLVAAWLTTRR